VRIDGEVAAVINKRKEDFYKEYYYLNQNVRKTAGKKSRTA